MILLILAWLAFVVTVALAAYCGYVNGSHGWWM